MKNKSLFKVLRYLTTGFACFTVLLFLSACAGDETTVVNPPDATTGIVDGTVQNSITDTGVEGVDITTDPGVGANTQTNAGGSYSLDLPVGIYTITFSKTSFTSSSLTVSVVAGKTTTKAVSLVPTSPVIVNAGSDQAGSIGGTVNLSVSVEVLNGGGAPTAFSWTQIAGAGGSIATPAAQTTDVTLGDASAYKAALFSHLKALDRFTVQGINPLSLEEAEVATFEVTATVNGMDYKDTVNITSHLPYAVNPGINTVPIGVPVLLHGGTQGGTQTGWSWSVTPPTGSSAALDSGSVQNPSFTPDVVGKYIISEANSSTTIDVYAGTWTGVIAGVDSDGITPVPDPGCLTANCHGGTAPDKFTPWKQSGHAHIFSTNLNTSTYYGESCFPCHTVGFNKDAANNGIDDQIDYGSFLSAGLINNPSPDNWVEVVNSYQHTARLANIQCENCHGPQNTGSGGAHSQGDPRTNISSDMCATCHGEPKRHARFQQWEQSKHGDYTLAISRGTSSHCGRCHAGQGFLTWLPQLLAGDPGDITAPITWTAETVHPQTCATCHDPHAQGTTSGEPNTATVRIQGNTPLLPAGFAAIGVGRGAICITCHNTRNGAHNDSTGAADDRAPHTPAQGDVLMGQNAYFVSVGGSSRSKHAGITDTCATCHMELTPPPPELSYNLGGTNHTFAASLDICSECHGGYDGRALQIAVEAMLEELKVAIEDAIITEINAQVTANNDVILFPGTANQVIISAGNIVNSVVLTEFRGRTAMDIIVDSVLYENVRLGSDTQVGTGTDTLLTSAAGQNIAKAAWNYFLVHGDGSGGIHNPSFIWDVMDGALTNLP